MKYIEAVNSWEGAPKPLVFLAGGITNCPDWQRELRMLIEDYAEIKGTILNPRRKYFPIHDPKASEEQIAWEYNALHSANLIVFWFAKGSLNPIVLYEYGVHITRLSMKNQIAMGASLPNRIVVGCDPEYPRKSDVIIQTRLIFSTLRVHESFSDFTKSVIEEVRYLDETSHMQSPRS